jgi:predicted nucleic acid-binding protein
VASSILAYPENRVALAAARRGGRLTAREHARALADFEDLQGELVSIGVDEALARRAGSLADELRLRGYDAVHLATALELGDDDVALVTWDADLRARPNSSASASPAVDPAAVQEKESSIFAVSFPRGS